MVFWDSRSLTSISFSFPVGFIEEFAPSVLGFLRVGRV